MRTVFWYTNSSKCQGMVQLDEHKMQRWSFGLYCRNPVDIVLFSWPLVCYFFPPPIWHIQERQQYK